MFDRNPPVLPRELLGDDGLLGELGLDGTTPAGELGEAAVP